MSRLSVILLCLALLPACDINGNDQRYPGASVFQAPDGGFHFHFLAPPWRYFKKEPKHLVHLVVDSYSQFNRSESEAISISHKLWVAYASSSTPQAEVQMLRNKAIGAGKTISDDVDQLTTLTGEQGWEYLAYKDEGEKGRFYYRDTAFTDASGRVVLFTMVAAYPLDVRDVDDLMRSFSAGPDEGTRTPKRLFDGSQPPQQPDQGLPDSDAADGGLP